jgi:hypothetical protein
MKSRLQICANYLEDVESRIVKLQASMDHDPKARRKVDEALHFIQAARKSFSKVQSRVDDIIASHSKAASG